MLRISIKYIICTLLIFLSIGCGDEYISTDEFIPSLESHYLRPSTSSFYFYTSKSDTEEFDVECLNTPWAFSDVPDWINLSPNSGEVTSHVSLTVSENPSGESGRTAIFFLKSTLPEWEYSRALSCDQPRATAELILEKNVLHFGGGAETQTINITANCSWSATSDASWVSLKSDVDNGVLEVYVSPNSGKNYRLSSIYINYGNGRSKAVNVSQYPATISSSITSLEYDNVASSYVLSIESEADWTSTVSDSWINVTPKKGNSGKSDVAIEVSPNTSVESRTGHVAFNTGSESKLQIDIVQRGLYIETSEELYFSASEETLSLNINSNTDWQILNSPNWLELSKTNGSGDDVISVVVSDNPNSASRSGEIVIGANGLDMNFVVHVYQQGKKLIPIPHVIEFSDSSGTKMFNVLSNAIWTSTCSDLWFNATPEKGEGNAQISVSVTENQSSIERTGNIEYKYADATTTVVVSQLAKYLTIDNKVFDFVSTGGTHTIDIATNSKWTAEVEHQVSWLKLSANSGKGDTQLVITAEDNPTINVRSTAIIIKSDHSQDVRILVSQQPRTLSISSQKVMFFADGGYSEYISVNTDGKYTVTSDASWFTISEGQGNTFRIYSAKNRGNDFREGKVTITLTDLVDCSLSLELPVVQAGQGGSFIIGGFKEDVDYDTVNSGNIGVTVIHYTKDKDWNNAIGGTLKVTATGYSSDDDWNKNDNANGRATITGYDKDENWDDGNNNSCNISGDDYPNDTNWNE